MANVQYHFHLETLSRTKGRSSVQYAAYVSASILKDNRYGVIHDETSKEEVRNSMIYLPDSAPNSWKEELKNCGNDKEKLRCFREKVWNNLEATETRNNAAVGKAFDAAYPKELNEEQRKICREKIIREFTSLGYVADFADHMIDHNPHLQGIISVRQMVNNEKSPWAAIKEAKEYVCESKLTGHRKNFKTVKEIEKYNKENNEQYEKVPVIDKKTGKQKLARRNEKVWLKKNVDNNPINKTPCLIHWRKVWEEAVNEFLAADNKQSCLSYKARGINRIPKKHNKYAAYKMGMKSDRIRENIEIEKANKELERIEQEQKELEPGMEEYREFQKIKDLSVEELLDNVHSIGKVLDDELFEDLGLKDKHPSMHISTGAINAIQREKEEEIEKFLKQGEEDDEDERKK